MRRLTPEQLKEAGKSKTLSPEVIRRLGLRILRSHPEGIRQADLIKETELELAFDHVVPKDSVRNALWNLEVEFSPYVIKKKTSYRHVFLFPTEELQKLIDETFINAPIVITPKSLKDEIKALADQSREVRRKKLSLKVFDLYEAIENSGIEKMLQETQESDFRAMTVQEIEALVGIKNAISQFNQYRNQLVHSQSLRERT